MVCHFSKIKIVIALVVLGVFLAGSFYFLTLASPIKKATGAFGILVFGLCFYQTIISLFKTGPGLVVDEKGIEDFQWGWGVIPWSDITAVSVKTIKSNKILSIQTQHPQNYHAKVQGPTRLFLLTNEILGFPMICSNFNILTPGVDEVFDHIKAQYPDKVVKD